MLGEAGSSQASAACIGVAPRRPETSDNMDDCSGVNPPSGKKRQYAMPCRGQVVDQGVAARSARL